MVALAVCVNFAWNLIVTLFFDGLREALGTSGTFWLFAVICAAALLFIFVLGTSGRARGIPSHTHIH